MNTPVVFLVFNRPDTTRKVFSAIRQAKPKQLLVIADGARPEKPGEAEKCAAVRSIIDTVDWDCDVLTNYSDVNLGCVKRVSSGLDWVFEEVEEAIILEDDCFPHPTFFRFCDETLQKYRDDKKVMAICGSNPLGKWKQKRQSYCYSHYFNCWGWATWSRAWREYSSNLKSWSYSAVQSKIAAHIGDRAEFDRYRLIFDRYLQGENNSWAYGFCFACLVNQASIVNSAVNLISNIGFDEVATNTKTKHLMFTARKTYSAILPLQPPANTALDRKFTSKQHSLLWERDLVSKIRRRLFLLKRV